jgi:hypothetical protein
VAEGDTHGVKMDDFIKHQCFPHDIQWVSRGTCGYPMNIMTKKNNVGNFGKQNACKCEHSVFQKPANFSFSKMPKIHFGFLGLLNVPPNTLGLFSEVFMHHMRQRLS